MNQELGEEEWYWGDTPDYQALEWIKDKTTGTFLVRNSSTPGEYTILLATGGAVKRLKIRHKFEKFGFVPPLNFPSIGDLVRHYSNHTLSHFNKDLPFKLGHPLSRHLAAAVTRDDVVELQRQFVELNVMCGRKSRRFHVMREEYAEEAEKLRVNQHALNALVETEKMFMEQIELQAEIICRAPPLDMAVLQCNFTQFRQRVILFQKDISDLKTRIQHNQQISTNAASEMKELKPELQTLYDALDEIRGDMKRYGMTAREVDALKESHELPLVDAHWDRATWWLEVGRREAEAILEGRADGTFLLRNSRHRGCYALSIRANGKTEHCKIEQKESGLGFADPYFIHESLLDLVLHYKESSLYEHNDTLDITLKYPVNEGLSQSEEEDPYNMLSTNQI